VPAPLLSEVEKGIVAGLLIGEGHFGGDGKSPQIVLKMHVRHEPLLRWLADAFPRSRLYGPYEYDGRHFFQWMARGAALASDVLPVLEEVGLERYDAHAGARLQAMKDNYSAFIERARARDARAATDPPRSPPG